MMDVYKNRFVRVVMRILSLVGIVLCIFFMGIAVFKIQPMFDAWVTQIEGTVTLIALSVWLISMLLNNLSSIDQATYKERMNKE